MDTQSVPAVRRSECVVCGEAIFEYVARGGRPIVLCSPKCRRERARQQRGYQPVNHPPKACDGCGEEFKPASLQSRYCSKQCARRSRKDRLRRFDCTCAGCGASFRGMRLQTFCSPACSAKHNGRHGGRPRADGSRAPRPARPVTAREYAAVISADPCAYCGGPAGEVDHIEPVHRGGADEWENYTAVCRACNTSKMTSPLLAFLLRRRVDSEIAALHAERAELLSL